MKRRLLPFVILLTASTAFSQPEPLTVEVTAIRANIRKAPSAKASIVKVVPKNTALPVYAVEAKQGWYLVRLGENWGGWIKASLVREKKAVQKSEGF